jgi:hypothetical protein
MIYDKEKILVLRKQVQEYWENLTLDDSIADVVIPDFIEKSTNICLLNKKDAWIISKTWKSNASNFLLYSNIKNKMQAIQILEDEIKFQNYLWMKKWNMYNT